MNSISKFADNLLDQTVVLSYTNIGYFLRNKQRQNSDAERDMRGQVCVVTGANAGLGRVVALALAERGASVHMLCRNAERGAAARQVIQELSGNDDVQLHVIDLSLQSDIRRFVAMFEQQHVDLLVNNAGVLLNERRVSAENVEMTFATNIAAPFLLTELLLPKLRCAPAARVINVTSGGMYAARLHLDDLQYTKRSYDGVKAYAESKRAEVIMTELWAKAWTDNDIAVHSVHPGWAATPGVSYSLPGFNRLMSPLLRSPEQGADGIIWLCVTPNLSAVKNGQLWFDRQIRAPHKWGVKGNDSAEIQQFWQTLHTLTNQTNELL